LLLRDLPAYANRVAQRRRSIKDPNYSSYLAAGQSESTPIAIDNPEYTPSLPQSAPYQLFISTLERQYQNHQATNYQRFHWLFLTYSPRGSWHLALIYSRVGKNAQDPTLLPPTSSSNTPVGEAVQTWLRDCRVGNIKP
jgi:hypothetical protein